jgi:hypothetical protein
MPFRYDPADVRHCRPRLKAVHGKAQPPLDDELHSGGTDTIAAGAPVGDQDQQRHLPNRQPLGDAGYEVLVAVWSGRGGFILTVSLAGGNAPEAEPGEVLLQRLERAVGRHGLDTFEGWWTRSSAAISSCVSNPVKGARPSDRQAQPPI